jgi:hypothetical protein
MGLQAGYLLAQDATFLGQVMESMLAAAIAIMAETNTVAGHAQRCELAKRVLIDPTTWQPKFAYALATQGGVTPQTVPSTVTDANINAAVSAIWNAMAGYFAN